MNNNNANDYTKDAFEGENPLHPFWTLLLLSLTKLEGEILCTLFIKSPKTFKNFKYLHI